MVNSITGVKSSINKGLQNCLEEFKDYTEGVRVLFLLNRKKEGGATQEEDRIFTTRVSFNSKEFEKNLKELWLIQEELYPSCRIYSSLNPRNINKAIFHLKKELLFAESYDEVGRLNLNIRVLKSSRHILMQPSCADDSLFLIDLDQEEIAEELPLINEHTETLKVYKTKNGWHIITKPFNYNLYKGKGEVKKDPLILLKYTES